MPVGGGEIGQGITVRVEVASEGQPFERVDQQQAVIQKVRRLRAEDAQLGVAEMVARLMTISSHE